MNWKEEFDNILIKCSDLSYHEEELKDFISHLIEEVINDIPDYIYSVVGHGDLDITHIKQELRDKWLGKEQE